MGKHIRAVGLAVLMVVSVAAPAIGAPASVESLSVDVTQSDDVTVTVTNGTDGAVANATVNVTTVDDSATYNGTGTYTTESDGTVGLPTPNETVEVAINATKDGVSETVTTNLTAAANGTVPFGLQVASFVSELNDTDEPRGLVIASWVTANNPGNGSGPPAHAGPGNETQGPPDHAGNNETENGTQGPPDHAGNDGNETQGPPNHAGNDEDGTNGNGNGGDNGNSNGAKGADASER